MNRTEIWEAIQEERKRQDKLHRGNSNRWPSEPSVKLTVLAEEFGEIAHAILEHDYFNLKEELIQTAAVCVSWLENIELHKEW